MPTTPPPKKPVSKTAANTAKRVISQQLQTQGVSTAALGLTKDETGFGVAIRFQEKPTQKLLKSLSALAKQLGVSIISEVIGQVVALNKPAAKKKTTTKKTSVSKPRAK